ncbi:MAG: GTPase Era [Anaerolineae bacterium]|nr:GTPase Era [Anaerolineae bacterium]
MIDSGPLFDEALPPDHRSGYIALVGKPNVGKSTLLNAWLGAKVAAVSPKPQTTRTSLLGILTRRDVQAIFVDTPGIHLPRTKLGEYMVESARRAIPDADVVLFMVDLATPPERPDVEVAKLLADLRDTPVILGMNKADLLVPDVLQERRLAYEALGDFSGSMAFSALTGYQRDELLACVLSRLPLGPRYYPADQLSDQQERFIASEIIREHLMRALQQEVPYAAAVIVQDFTERENGVLYISANIYVERDSQKGIVIGRGGSMLKRIGREARLELQEIWERPVYLELWVKVLKNWRRSEEHLRRFGYAGST